MTRERKLISVEERRKNIRLLTGVAAELSVGIPWFLYKQTSYEIARWNERKKRYLSAIRHTINAETEIPIVIIQMLQEYKKGTFFVNHYPVITAITLIVQQGVQGQNLHGVIKSNTFNTLTGKEMQVISLSKAVDPNERKESITFNSARWPITIPYGQFPYKEFQLPANNLHDLSLPEIDPVISDIILGTTSAQDAQGLIQVSSNRSVHIITPDEKGTFIRDCNNLFQSIGEAI